MEDADINFEYLEVIVKAINQFYRKDLVSGKIEAKNKAALLFAKENNMKFEFVLDKDVDNFISTLLNE